MKRKPGVEMLALVGDWIGGPTTNRVRNEFEPTWVARKMPVYCGPHGKRICGYLNGIGGCRDCFGICVKFLKTVGESYDENPEAQ